MKVVTNKVGRQFFKLTVTLLRNSSSGAQIVETFGCFVFMIDSAELS